MNRPANIRASALLLALAAALPAIVGGCVTESQRPTHPLPRPIPSQPQDKLPDGPVATAATTAQSSTARLRLMIRPLGSIPFDGMVLPLVSPDGRFLATQVGLAPSWDLLLAAPGNTETSGARPVVYDLTVPQLAEIPAPTDALPNGLLLGRSCDTTGFIVELPRDDGSRWLGRVDWLSQRINWLAQDDAVNAHATCAADGAVIWSRRRPGSQVSELVLRAPGGATAIYGDPKVSLHFPTIGDDPSIVFAFAITEKATELVAIRFQSSGLGGGGGGGGGGGPRFGGVVARRAFLNGNNVVQAYQSIVACQTPPATPATPPIGLAYLNPAIARVTEWNTRTNMISVLPERSYSAVRAAHFAPNGYVTSAENGLFFSPDPGEGLDRNGLPKPRPAAAPLFDLSDIPRATRVPESPLILLRPLKDSADPRIAIIVASPAPE